MPLRHTDTFLTVDELRHHTQFRFGDQLHALVEVVRHGLEPEQQKHAQLWDAALRTRNIYHLYHFKLHKKMVGSKVKSKPKNPSWASDFICRLDVDLRRFEKPEHHLAIVHDDNQQSEVLPSPWQLGMAQQRAEPKMNQPMM